MRILFSTLALVSFALVSYALAFSQSPSIIYVTLSSTQPSVSVVYVTVGTPLFATPSSAASVTYESVTRSTGRYTVETGATIDYGDLGTPSVSSEATITNDSSDSATETSSLTALDSLTTFGSLTLSTSSATAGFTVTVTETVTASNTADPTSTSIYLPQFTTTSRRHRFF